MAGGMNEEPNVPVSFPIKTLKDLEDGTYFKSFHFMFNKSTVPLKGVSTARAKRPRLLACHDYKGGYLDDQWIQGSQNDQAYTLTNWRLLDIFIYFSHNLVTLPPPCWINAGHKHGVQVLGTFITEWDEGVKVCQELCASEDSAVMYASLLAELAQALGFDGWLINIENRVIDLVPNLQLFVTQLTQSMHAWVPGSTVIWYDSVTEDGRLNWQNRLNEKNISFFEISDSFFTNYTWQREWAKESGDLAGKQRASDIYMGIDVFGRGTYGGGKFQCDVALKVAKDAGVSAALFAPGWSYENNEDDKRWWGTIENSWPDARLDPVELPFFTNFDIGRGRATFIEGVQVSDLPWSNLSCQSLQPLLHLDSSSLQRLKVTLRQDSAVYSGGSAIRAVGDLSTDEPCVFQLYHTAVSIEDGPLSVSYSVSGESSSNIFLVMTTEDPSGDTCIHVLMEMTKQMKDECTVPLDIGFRVNNVTVKYNFSRLEDDNDHSGGVGSSRISGSNVIGTWIKREFTLEKGKYIITGIFGLCFVGEDVQMAISQLLIGNQNFFDAANFHRQAEALETQTEKVGANDGNYRVLLGHLSLANSSHNCHFPASGQRFVGTSLSWTEGNAGEQFINAKLVWRGHIDKSTWERFHLYVKTAKLGGESLSSVQYLGTAMVEAFYVSALSVPKLSTALKFYLQPECACGNVQSLTTCSTYEAEVPGPTSSLWMRPQPSLKDWLF